MNCVQHTDIITHLP